MTDINPNLNTIVFHIIGTITLWNLSHMLYNFTTIETKPYNNNYMAYTGISSLCMITSLAVMSKYM